MEREIKFVNLDFILDLISNFQKSYVKDSEIYDVLDDLVYLLVESTQDLEEYEIDGIKDKD